MPSLLKITHIYEGSQAAELELIVGDLIVSVGDRFIHTSDDLDRALSTGEHNAKLKIYRNCEVITVFITASRLGVECALDSVLPELYEQILVFDCAANTPIVVSSNIILASTHDIPGRRIASVVDLITVEDSFLIEGSAIARIFFPTTAGSSTKMEQCVGNIKERLKYKAARLGADAVVGVSINSSGVNTHNNVGVFVVYGVGTAVKLCNEAEL